MSYNKKDWIQVTIPLKPEEHTEIKAKAEQQECSMANYIRAKLLDGKQKGEKK